MSWATIVSDAPEVHNELAGSGGKSEEAMLHELRVSYNEGLHNLTRSNCFGDADFTKGLALLEEVSRRCSEVDTITSTLQVREIGFLANKNRIDNLWRSGAHDGLYGLALETLSVMIELDRLDVMLVLQTARLAKQAGDLWSYQQLIMAYSDKLPTLYKHIVLHEVSESLDQRSSSAITSVQPIFRLLDENITIHEAAAWKLANRHVVPFVHFLFDKVKLGHERDHCSLVKGFDLAWIAPDNSSNEMEVDGESPPRSSSQPANSCPDLPAAIAQPAPAQSEPVDACIEVLQPEPQAEPLQVEVVQAAEGEAGPPSSRRSGRANRRAPARHADSYTAVEDVAASGNTIAAVTVEAAGVSAAASSGGTVGAIVRMLAQLSRSGDKASSSSSEGPLTEQELATLRAEHPVPRLACQGESDGTGSRNIASPARTTGGSATTTPQQPTESVSGHREWTPAIAAPLFDAFRVVVCAGDGGLAQLAGLYTAVLVFCADSINWSLLQGWVEVDELVLRCWRGLLDVQTATEAELLACLNHQEALLLLESALSVTAHHDQDTVVVSTAEALFTPLLMWVLNPPSTSRQSPPDDWKFWLRVSTPELQLRALWAVAQCCRRVAPAMTSNELHLRELLLELQTLLGDRILSLPHAPALRVSRRECSALLSTLQYEGEVKDLVLRQQANKGWVRKAIALIEKSHQLRQMMQAPIDAVKARAGAEQPVPILVLEVSQNLQAPGVWLDAVAVLLKEAASAVVSDGLSSATTDGQWLVDLLQQMVQRIPEADLSSTAALREKVTALIDSLAMILTAATDTCDTSIIADDVVVLCVRLGMLLVQAEDASNFLSVRRVLRNAVVHALIVMTTTGANAGHAQPQSVPVLWKAYSDLGGVAADHVAQLSSVCWLAMAKLAACALQRAESVAPLGSSLLLILVQLVAEATSEQLPAKAQAELLVALFDELREQQSAAQRKASKVKKSAKNNNAGESSVTASAEARRTAETRLTLALENSMRDDNVIAQCTHREQRSLVSALGHLYYNQYGFLLFQAVRTDGEHDEDVNYDFSEAGLTKLYTFALQCRDRGWVGKAELRSALLQLSRAPVLTQFLRAAPASGLLDMMLRGAGPVQSALSALVAAQTWTRAESAVSADVCNSYTTLRSVCTELYHELLLLGVTSSELYTSDDEEETQEGDFDRSGAVTTLKSLCEVGDVFDDPRGAFAVEAYLRDLVNNPLRLSSWRGVWDLLMQAYNGLSDELQKELLVDRLPSSCSDLGAGAVDLLLPTVGLDSAGVYIWRPAARLPTDTVTAVLDASVIAAEERCGTDVVAAFEGSLALETLCNRRGRMLSTDEQHSHLRRLCFLLQARSAAYRLVERVRTVVQHCTELVAARDGNECEDEVEDADQTIAEIYALVLKNALRSVRKDKADALLKTELRAKLSQCLTQDCFFGNDLFALTTTATVTMQRAVDATNRTAALSMCARVAQALRAESGSRGAYSKPVRVVAMCEVCSVCLRWCLMQLQEWGSGGSRDVTAEDAELELAEECLRALVKWPAALTAVAVQIAPTAVASEAPAALQEDIAWRRLWIVLCAALCGLKECRKIDNFDFRSVYRLSRTVHKLSALLTAAPHLAPPADVAAFLATIGVREISAAWALQELAKLFDKKRPQIVAMWCVENATSAWEKELLRVSQFDTLRRKYIDRYLHLAVECVEVEVILDVLAFALSAARHATAVVMHALQEGVRCLHAVLVPLLNPDDDADVETLCKRADKRQAAILCAGRTLQLLYELHCQVEGRLAVTVQALLLEVMVTLAAYLDLTPAAVQRSVSGSNGNNPSTIAQGNEPLEPSAATPSEQELATSPAQTLLERCAARWGACRLLNKTEIGKRNKGHFHLTTMERSQSGNVLRQEVEVEPEPEAAVAVADNTLRSEVLMVMDGIVEQVLLKAASWDEGAAASLLSPSRVRQRSAEEENGEEEIAAVKAAQIIAKRRVAMTLSSDLIADFQRDGVVVIPSVLSDEEVAAALDGLHNTLARYGYDHTRMDETALELGKLSSTYGAGGILDIFYEEWKLKLNEHPAVVEAMQSLWAATYADPTCQTDFSHPFGPFSPFQGHMYIDRVCYRVPSRVSALQGKSKKKQLQRSLTPHLDCCPHYMYGKNSKWRPIQAFLCLTDTLLPDQGGFEACLGHHRGFHAWAASRAPGPDGSAPPCVGDFTPIRPVEDRGILEKMQHIRCKAGDMVCWDYRIPHANARYNHAEQPRAVVYIGLLPAVPVNERYAAEQLRRYREGKVPTDQWHESSALQPCDYPFSELGQKLMGITPWTES